MAGAASALLATFPVGRSSGAAGVIAAASGCLALAPLLVATRSRSPGSAFVAAAGAGAAATALSMGGIWWGLTRMYGVQTIWALLAIAVPIALAALHWGIPFALVTATRRRLPIIAIFPLVWACAEALRGVGVLGFPWGTLGMSLLGDPHLAQLASIGGVPLLSLLAALVAATCAQLVDAHRTRKPVPRGPLVLCLAAMLAAHAYGWVRTSQVGRLIREAPAVRVGIVQSNFDSRVNAGLRSEAEEYLAAHVGPTRTAYALGADLVVWPEAAYPGILGSAGSKAHLALPDRLIPAGHRLLVGAIVAADGGSLENAALLVGDDGTVLGDYGKQHLVPGGEYLPTFLSSIGARPVVGESLTAGPGGLVTSDRPDGTLRIGSLICFESMFASLARRHAADGANLLAVLTNDAAVGTGVSARHFFDHTRLRAIETGRFVVRASRTGMSGFVSPTGEVEAVTDVSLRPVDVHGLFSVDMLPTGRSETRSVALLAEQTLYTRLGPLGWMVPALAVLVAAWLPHTLATRRTARRRSPASDAAAEPRAA